MATVKPKRLVMVRHFDGRTEYICKNCGQKMEIRDDYRMSFGRGEVEESGGEYLKCTSCGVISRDFSIPGEPKSWADLDEANKKDGHYGRGKPDWLIKAKDKLDQLCKREIEIIDAWEKGQAHDMEVAAVQVEREEAEVEYGRLFDLWNSHKPEGTHTNRIAEMVPEWAKS